MRITITDDQGVVLSTHSLDADAARCTVDRLDIIDAELTGQESQAAQDAADALHYELLQELRRKAKQS